MGAAVMPGGLPTGQGKGAGRGPDMSQRVAPGWRVFFSDRGRRKGFGVEAERTGALPSGTAWLSAGLAYFAVVFAVGFALGTVRVLVVAPHLGETAAVLAELPVMLAIAWTVCGWLLKHVPLPDGWGQRLAMGGVALAFLLAAELGLVVLAFGRTVAEHLAGYGSPAGALGLAGQLAFASFPLVRGRGRQRPDVAPPSPRLRLAIVMPGIVAMFDAVRAVRLEDDA